MKPSRYNHFFSFNDTQSIAYNALTNSLALIDISKLEAFQSYCDKGTPMPDELVMDLRKGMFLIDESFDELTFLRFNMLKTRFSTNHLSLTISPCNDCNFKCVYCYEKKSINDKYMTAEIEDKLVELLDRHKKVISSMYITWHGGEPLLAFDIVERLSKRFIEICEKNEINYNSSMVTNGYLLSRDILSKMDSIKCTALQITVDGPQEVHDKMRPLTNGEGTYDVIMDNIKNGYDLLPATSLRVNIDKNNASAGEEVYFYLRENELLDKVKPYYGKLVNDTDTYESSICLTGNDFAEMSYDFRHKVLGASAKHPVDFPYSKATYCQAEAINSHCIDAEGWIYRCWADVGLPDKRVGSLLENISLNSNVYFEYIMHDPTLGELCGSCDVLPLCMGGCPLKRVIGNDDTCVNYKYVLEKCIRDSTNVLKTNRDMNAQSETKK